MSTLVRERPTTPAGHRPSPPPPESTWRLRHFAACVLLTAFAFNNSSGLIVGDTKLDLAVRPWAFLGRALSMWDPQDSAGQVQNQAYGYLFPMGPFFGIGQSAHLPMWAVQRLWWAVLLCTAFLGVVALARRLGVGSPASRMIAGLAFALSPHVLSVLGPVSAEAQPMCLAPWVLVPLVDGMRGGSARRAAMRSGLAVLLMGAINAALVLAALVPAALWLLAHRPDPRMRRLAGAWVLAVGLATAWWVTPLILFGQYGVPFLGRIEQATTTTSTATLVETIRGTSDWVGYLPGSGWRAAALLLTSPAVIVETVAVAALGLAGLASRRMPYRGWLVACLLVGTVAICAGYLGTVHGLFAPEVQQLLDSSLAPLRNVHKFDVVLRLPLALGLAHVAGRLSWGQAAERRVSRVLLVAVAAVAVVGAATPLLALRIAPAGAFASVPRYWTQAANWLTARNAAGRALLVPGSRFGTYVWGRPMDEPLEPLADTPWEVRAAVPLATPGHVRLLDAVDAELAAGRPSAGLAAALARSGITYLVVRNDLDQPATETSRPVVVHEALAGSPGLRLVRSFGPPVGQDALFGRVVDQHLQLPYHAVEIWHVAGPRERRVSAAPVSSVTQVSGGPESLLPLSGAGLPVGAPTVLTGDAPASLHPKQVVLTDGMRRREADYGAGSQDTSATLAPGDPRRLAGPERDWLPFRGLRHQTYVRYLGARAIRASSSGSDANAFGGPNRLSSPYSAFDGSPRTAWTSNLATRGVGEWLEIDFDHPRVLHHVRVRFAESSTATRVRVDTSSGHAAAEVSNGTWLSLPVPAGTSSFLRITVTAVQPGAGFRPVAISEVSIPGVHVARTLVMPDDLAPGTRVDQVLINATDDARNRCVFVATRPLCAVGLGSLGEEFTGLDRTFDLPAGGRYRFTAVAVPRADAALLKVLAAAVHPSITAHASSHAIGDPLARPEAAVDVDLGTGWIAAADDPRPTITLRWAHPRTISSLTIVTDPLLAATPPDQVRLSSAQGSREATIARDGAVRFAPITTRRIRLTLTSSTGLLANINPFGGAPQWLGIGVSEIAVDGVPATSRAASDPLPVDLPCGAGPTVKVDGTPFYTRVHTTVAALRDRRPVPVVVCAPGGVIRLRTGWHRIQVHSTALWTPTALRLQRTPAAPPPLPGLPVQVRSWGATDRAVAIGSRASETVVTVHENVNAGWHAAIDGKPLTPITVDGWEQGYLVPAGPAAVIELHYAPDDWYRTALVAGLVAALLLVAAAFARPRRPRTATLPPARTWRADGRGGPALVALSLAVAVLVAGPAGAATWAAVGAVAVLARAGVRRRPWLRHVLPALAAGSYAAAGLVLAVRHWNLPGYAGGTVVVQLLCVAALVATTWTPLRLPTRVSRPPSAARAPLMIPEEQPAPELDGDDSAPAGAAS